MSGEAGGRVAVVTGAGHGLGKAYALAFAASGVRVVLNDLGLTSDGTPTAELVAHEVRSKGGTACSVHADVASASGADSIIAAALESFGRVDAVVNNAGVVPHGSVLDLDVDQALEAIRVHLGGTVLVTRSAIESLRSSAAGRVVNTISNSVFGMADIAAYAAAKGAVLAATKALALELAGSRVKVNAVAPMAHTNPGRTANAEAAFAGLGSRATAEWVAPLVQHLSSPECRATGELYSAVGGRYARIVFGVTRGWLADGTEPPTPDEVARAFAEVEDEQHLDIVTAMAQEATLVAARLS